jgi:anaerobic selenocysteine-containing dehydrogenase
VLVAAAAETTAPASDQTDPGVDPEAGEAAVAAEAADTVESEQAAETEALEAQAEAEAPPEPAIPPPPPGPTPPAVLAFTAPDVAEAPAVDAYSLRLVATRKLYDLGTDAQHSRGLAGLTSDTVLRLHPHDFDRLGVDPGTNVTVTAASGSVTLPVQPDAAVGKGAAAVVLHQPGPAVGALIDATSRVTEVRVVKA